MSLLKTVIENHEFWIVVGVVAVVLIAKTKTINIHFHKSDK